MKHIALVALVAFSIVTAASAKTITSSQGNANEKSAAAVAGPAAAANKSGTDTSSAQPSKKALKKSKIKTPPPLHDPN